VLVWALLFRESSTTPGSSDFSTILIGAVSVAALLVAVVTAAVIVVRAAGARREERHAPSIAAWKRTWRDIATGRTPCPAGPLTDDAVIALLAVRESVDPPDSDRVAAAIGSTGTDQVLLSRLADIAPAGADAGGFRRIRGSRQFGIALDTLDDLATARIPRAVPTLVALTDHHEEAIRVAALRAASRSIAVMPAGERRTAAALDLLDHIRRTTFARGALDEGMLLLGAAAEPVIRTVLAHSHAGPTVIASCLDSVARLRIGSVGPLINRYLSDDQPVEVRGAAFRALASLPVFPPEAATNLREGLSDPQDVVRIQAARGTRHMAAEQAVSALVPMLGDRSWSVRRAAAETLVVIPDLGPRALVTATTDHPDPFARDMASQVVRDRAIRELDDITALPESA
jgi:HEAT repeat protein